MNKGKELSLKAFKKTLDKLKNKEKVSEVTFRDLWLEEVKNIPMLTLNGWYVPPPDGVTVLSASDKDIKRINFESLRTPNNWPSENEIIDWDNGLLFAYSSFIDVENGLLGDFDITLYFGKNKEIINHFKLCHKATKEVIDKLNTIDSSKFLFEKSQEIFSKYGLKNSIASVSDLQKLNLGHNIPIVNFIDIKSRILSDEVIERIRNTRKFINGASDWVLSSEEQFTVEPQLVSIDHPELPQVCFHYLIKKTENGEVIVMNENDELLKEYGLLS